MSDLIAFGLAGLVLKYTGVVNGMRLSFLIDGAGAFMFICLSGYKSLIPLTVCLCRVGSTMTYNMGYVSVTKLFPVKFTATVYGLTNVVAHICACFAPIVAEIKPPYPFLFFASSIGLQLLSTFWLGEIE